MKRIIGLCILVASTAIGASSARAELDYTMLPPYCKWRLQGAPGQYEAGQRQFGIGNWDHMHHYCNALDWMNKYRRARSAQEKQFLLNNAAGDYNYMVTHSRPDFFLRPQIYMGLAEVYKLQKNVGGAAKILEQAVAFQPTLERAHIDLVDVLKNAGARDAALDAATRGLRNVPASKRLQQSYLDLGGKRPFPEPLTTPVTPSVPAPELPSAKPDREEIPTEPTIGRKELHGSDSSSDEWTVDSGCRFCPPEEIKKRWRDSFGNSK